MATTLAPILALAIPAILMTEAATAPATQPVAGTVERLGWLAGCWIDESAGRVTQEHWMNPSGGTMLGMSRTVAGGKTVAYEHLRIEERGGKLVYVALPSGQRLAEFAQLELTDRSVVFSNPGHDFPQRVRYTLQDDGSVMARIEGERGGALKTIDFPMRRTVCEDPKP